MQPKQLTQLTALAAALIGAAMFVGLVPVPDPWPVEGSIGAAIGAAAAAALTLARTREKEKKAAAALPPGALAMATVLDLIETVKQEPAAQEIISLATNRIGKGANMDHILALLKTVDLHPKITGPST